VLEVAFPVHGRLRAIAGHPLAAAALVALVLASFGSGCHDDGDSSPADPTRSAIRGPVAARLTAGDLEEPGATLSPNAQIATYETLREDMERARNASDGGGKAWLEYGSLHAGSEAPEVVAGEAARFEIVYEAGPLGVAVGGVVFLQVSPFWGWSPPQIRHRRAPGYTEVDTEADGVELRPSTLGPVLAITIGGRDLRAGERVRIVYGAGPARATVDRYAGRSEHLWILVDGDGDEVRAPIAQSPRVDIVAGKPAALHVVAPTTARPGEAVRVAISLLDAAGNAGPRFDGDVRLHVEGARPERALLPSAVTMSPADGGSTTAELRVDEPGVYRVIAEADLDSSFATIAMSGPIVVRPEIARVLWGDLHGHSGLSDGTGMPEDYFTYARDVAGLDVAALTDHDHWGMRFLDATPAYWTEIKESVAAFNAPGRFTTLLGYEWTSWLYGHRHVLAFGDDMAVLSSMDERTDTPRKLWDALAGQPVLTFAHHSAGGPIGTDWAYAPDPVLEPLTEIVSVHGCSEALDAPAVIHEPMPGNFVRDALDLGYRFGFVGSGDSHDGHPGLAHLQGGVGLGGLAAIFAQANDRASVLTALRAHRVYATNGARIWLDVTLDGAAMGTELAAPVALDSQSLSIDTVGEVDIAKVDIVRSGEVVESIRPEQTATWRGVRSLSKLERGEYLYVRVVQTDGGAAWSSPIYVVR